jgi:hypothetical protein
MSIYCDKCGKDIKDGITHQCSRQVDVIVSDKERLDWLEKNASKIGIKPDWTYGIINKIGYSNKLDNEYTNIRKRIDELMAC